MKEILIRIGLTLMLVAGVFLTIAGFFYWFPYSFFVIAFCLFVFAVYLAVSDMRSGNIKKRKSYSCKE